MLIAGGCVTDGCGTATAETFVVEADGSSYRPGPAMSDPRDAHTATPVPDGRIVLAGGYAGEGQGPLSSIEAFDPSTGTIEKIGDLMVGRGDHVAALGGDGRVLIAGGWTGPNAYTATTEIFDPSTGFIEPGPDMPVAATALAATSLADGRILVTGGQVDRELATTAAAVYDPIAAAWTEVGPMSTPRSKHASVLLGDGSVLVIGGSTGGPDLLASTEVFDPATGRFVPGPDLAEPRFKLQGGAVVDDHGRVVIAGGGRSIEVLDVAQERSAVVSTLAERGSFATASLLGSGAILVLGGYDDRVELRRELRVVSSAGPLP